MYDTVAARQTEENTKNNCQRSSSMYMNEITLPVFWDWNQGLTCLIRPHPHPMRFHSTYIKELHAA